MQLAVLELLQENEKLPESERIDRHEFELVTSVFPSALPTSQCC